MSDQVREEPPPGEDRLIGWSATVSVIVVTAIAAVISYGHARELVQRYGATGWSADALPLTIDGLVATCSLILVDCARHHRDAPWQAWFLLITGAMATIAANVAAGLSHGLIGAIIAGWPALVATCCFDLLLRHRRSAPAGQSDLHAIPPAADPAIEAAREHYAADLARRKTPAIRAIKRDFHCGTPRATAIRDAIAPADATPGRRAA